MPAPARSSTSNESYAHSADPQNQKHLKHRAGSLCCYRMLRLLSQVWSPKHMPHHATRRITHSLAPLPQMATCPRVPFHP